MFKGVGNVEQLREEVQKPNTDTLTILHTGILIVGLALCLF